jgi:hypothetical protein
MTRRLIEAIFGPAETRVPEAMEPVGRDSTRSPMPAQVAALLPR